MGITNTESRITYAGNDSTTSFAFNFRVFETSDIVVIYRNDTTGVESTLVETTNYTVTLNSGEGGTVNTTFTPASGYTIYIGKNVAETQPESITVGNLPSATLEQMSDRLTMMIHQVKEITRRVPLFSRSTPSVDKTLAEPEDGSLIGWDASGNLINYSSLTLSGATVLDEDDLVSDSATAVPTQQSVKAYVDNLIVDEDDMASNSASLLPTQQSVKAYVDQKGKYMTTQTFTSTSTIGDTVEHARAFNAITLTLPDASGETGKVMTLTNTNSSVTEVIIDGESSDLVGGVLTRSLFYPQESITIVSNGSGWDIIDWYVPSPTLVHVTRASLLSTSGSSDVQVTSLSETFDNYSTFASDTFTAPKDMYVEIHAYMEAATFDAFIDVRYQINAGSSVVLGSQSGVVGCGSSGASSLDTGVSGSTLISLSSGDTIKFYINGNGLNRNCDNFRFIIKEVITR